MESICGVFDCSQCEAEEACGGCRASCGRPFGGQCIAAETITAGGREAYDRLQKELTEAFNALGIPGLKVEGLNLLSGSYVNLSYPLPSGQTVQFLKDKDIYLGSQIEVPGQERCYGIVTDGSFLLVCSYGCGGSAPEIVCYKKLVTET